MIEIKELNYAKMRGQSYSAEVCSEKFLSIEPNENGFEIEWKKSDSLLRKTLTDSILSDWLDNPIAYGAYENEKLIGFVEGFLEKWNNRFRISNICVFDTDKRNSGIGHMLLKQIMIDAFKSNARMAVLETQSYNSKAISFYKKNGFEIIGFDRYAYSNNGPKEHNMRIEMGKSLK